MDWLHTIESIGAFLGQPASIGYMAAFTLLFWLIHTFTGTKGLKKFFSALLSLAWVGFLIGLAYYLVAPAFGDAAMTKGEVIRLVIAGMIGASMLSILISIVAAARLWKRSDEVGNALIELSAELIGVTGQLANFMAARGKFLRELHRGAEPSASDAVKNELKVVQDGLQDLMPRLESLQVLLTKFSPYTDRKGFRPRIL